MWLADALQALCMQLKWTEVWKARPPKPSEIGVRGDWGGEERRERDTRSGKVNLGRTGGHGAYQMYHRL
jgi:hypothetical protein